jgi:hypothetical protein
MTKFGHEIHQSAFPDDDGSATPAVRLALEIHHRTQSALSLAGVITELRHSRLLVPVIAVADQIDEHGADKDSHISSVIFQSNDGRRGMPAFTGTDSLSVWQPDARPIAQYAYAVAQSCLEAELDGLLIDMASPHRVAISGEALKRLAWG